MIGGFFHAIKEGSMAEPRKGRQTPTQSVVLPYYATKGQEAIDLYNASGRTAQEW